MLITIADDTFSFNSETPDLKPMGPSEKSVSRLARSLVSLGNLVRVYNKIEKAIVSDGVSWIPLDQVNASQTDILIAHNNPKLLELIPDSKKKILWLTKAASYLTNTSMLHATVRSNPIIVCQGEGHGSSIPNNYNVFVTKVISNAVSDVFLNLKDSKPNITPSAVVTTHPLNGLDWLLDIWNQKIHPRLPWAELHIFSSILNKGISGGSIDIRLEKILNKISTSQSGIKVFNPLADPQMSKKLTEYRVHLYPSMTSTPWAGTLAESQAVGIPAISRPFSSVGEHIVNGKTGYITADKNQFSEYAYRLLNDISAFTQMSENCKFIKKRRDWNDVAKEFEELACD